LIWKIFAKILISNMYNTRQSRTLFTIK